MAMPAVADHREHARLRQLREMGAGGLRRDSRRRGKLARGQGTTIEKRGHHRGSRRISDQRRDLGDDGACDHFRSLTRRENELVSIRSSAARIITSGRHGDEAKVRCFFAQIEFACRFSGAPFDYWVYSGRLHRDMVRNSFVFKEIQPCDS